MWVRVFYFQTNGRLYLAKIQDKAIVNVEFQ